MYKYTSRFTLNSSINRFNKMSWCARAPGLSRAPPPPPGTKIGKYFDATLVWILFVLLLILVCFVYFSLFVLLPFVCFVYLSLFVVIAFQLLFVLSPFVSFV